MIGKDQISVLVNKIAVGYKPLKIILFGSYANGNANEDSDLDIFVIKESDIPRPQRIFQLRKMLYGTMLPIDLLVYTPDEVERSKADSFSFVNEILTNGKVVYEAGQ